MLLFSWFVMLGIWMPQETQVGGIVQEGANLRPNTVTWRMARIHLRLMQADAEPEW